MKPYFSAAEVEAFEPEYRDQMDRLRAMHDPVPVRDGPLNRRRRNSMMSSLPDRLRAGNLFVMPEPKPRISRRKRVCAWLVILAAVAVGWLLNKYGLVG